VSQIRCAVYARYSADKQNPLSIDDQVRKCREFGERKGWELLDPHRKRANRERTGFLPAKQKRWSVTGTEVLTAETFNTGLVLNIEGDNRRMRTKAA
jgi:hypothetical protein